MKHVFFLLFMLPLLANAQMASGGNTFLQHEPGVKWVQNMNWQEIKTQAKAQHKYIFVDCNATWCKPCKIMDKDVFPNDTIANLINNNFLAVKVQVDTSKNDDATTRNLYAAAREFERQYKVTGVPTFLFFSPDGEIVHKDAGAKKVGEFISLVQNALNPSMQNYTLIQDSRAGRIDYNLLPLVIKQFRELGDKDLAIEQARSYMKNYLEQLPENLFAAKSNQVFLIENQQMLTSQDRIYSLSKEKPALIDSVLYFFGAGIAGKIIKSITINENVVPPIELAKKSNLEPDWNEIREAVVQKVDSVKTADILLDAQLYWYATKKNWVKYSHYYFIRANQTDLTKISSKELQIFQLNTFAWDLFLYSHDKNHLEKALIWVDEAIKLKEQDDPGLLDTKANLLYKLGRKKQAIPIQEKAASLMKRQNSEIHIALEKMKRGLPTWEN
ncbi:DUF255 domain-containing protein [Paraflavitalea soli]|uniref:DUF255 domain-containing protein n=1 Tax=Paraflavitalea soli TaxID=2315862 RepID=A0A3B7MJY5_9BACT|nr:thioredoxin fold domain-containing protein [Paraflavitalea soli]AXY74764.1 DUF255 domain-containing protein [Paraflavitalea soli]